MGKQNGVSIFKLGGKSLGRSNTLITLPAKIYDYAKTNQILCVCSATEHTTKDLISLYHAIVSRDRKTRNNIFKKVQDRHYDLVVRVFTNKELPYVKENLGKLFALLWNDVTKRASYPCIVSYGEIISTSIFSALLASCGKVHATFDSRPCIRTTGSLYRSRLNLNKCEKFISQRMPQKFKRNDVLVTYGYLGQDYQSGKTSLLPLNGSDLTAGVFGHVLDTYEVNLVKDVKGVIIDINKDINDPTNIHTVLSHNEYSDLFKGEEVYPAYPESIELLGIKKVPVNFLWDADFNQYGTRIETE